MFYKMFDVTMAVLAVCGLILPLFGVMWGYSLLCAPAGAYTGAVISKFMTNAYN